METTSQFTRVVGLAPGRVGLPVDASGLRVLRPKGGNFALLSPSRVKPSIISVACEPANPPVVESLLRSLPAWFGIEDVIVEYVTTAARLSTYVARDVEGAPVGVLLVARHFPAAAAVFLMAVDPARHRTGIGRALVGAAEDDLVADDVRLLQVMTLGPSRPDRSTPGPGCPTKPAVFSRWRSCMDCGVTTRA